MPSSGTNVKKTRLPLFIRGRFFVHFFQGKFRGKFSPKNVGKKWNFPQKKLRKIVFPRNSAELSAESDFPWKNVRKIGGAML
jgi:hypothetical protein